MNDYYSGQQRQSAEYELYVASTLRHNAGRLAEPLTGTQRVVKRGIDVAASVMLLALLLPALIVIAVAVLLETGAPVFFRQARGGLGGRTFHIVKFRTMSVQENGCEITQARRGDPRVTKVGAFLRRTSLDELPQLWNVLKGDMSLVGPRPHALVHDLQYGAVIGPYALRQRLKPGITGLAQVEGQRGETASVECMARRVEADNRYIENWSLGLDIMILVRTAGLVFFDRSAY